VTHAGPEAYQAVSAKISDAVYNPVSRTIVVNRQPKSVLVPGVTVVTGGTADIPVAEEAAVTAELMGNKVDKIFDVEWPACTVYSINYPSYVRQRYW